jgi:hypothetical protein
MTSNVFARRKARPEKVKVTVDIECTPLEARQFFGLPDVQPLQAALLAQMEKKMTAEMEKFSPEALMKSWFVGTVQGAEWFRGMLGAMAAKPDAATDPARKG